MILVIGAGAAGLMAAAHAAEAGAAVTLVERTADGGRKILISGGGRCNVLPAALEPERFVSASPAHLVRRLLRAWPLEHQQQFFEATLGVPLAFEDDSRKYFPASNRARDVRDALVAHARRQGVAFEFGTTVNEIARDDHGGWRVTTDRGSHDARAVIVATGGLSVPATGSDGRGLAIARACGHTIHPTYPALTPLLADPPVHASLAGVSLTARVRVRVGERTRESTGGFLFTHRGYSGPVVLDLSHEWSRVRGPESGVRGPESGVRGPGFGVRGPESGVRGPGFGVRGPESGVRGPGSGVRFLVAWSDRTREEWELGLSAGGANVATVLGGVIPQRLADFLIADAGIPDGRRVSDLRRHERLALIERLTACPLPVTGDEGYKKAEVTGGGVALDEVDPHTLESRLAPGLFFCGEVLDAFGPIGGHNFAWAWSTGRAAGEAAGKIDAARADG